MPLNLEKFIFRTVRIAVIDFNKYKKTTELKSL